MNLHVADLAPPPAVRTTCPYCGVGCGVLAQPDGSGQAAVAGDPEHPANFGRLCSKGSALGETLSLDGRLLHPEIAGRRASWDEALDAVAGGLQRIIEQDGPDAVAFYLSGQLLTEDYYVANKLMKGFIGSPHVDTNSRLCMASSVAGHRRAFGSDTVPGAYEDLDQADLVVLVGSNTAWCHPVLFQRMLEARRRRGTRIVVLDPRRTATADEADIVLALAPGSDTALFAGLLVRLADSGEIDQAFVAAHTQGFEAALAAARTIAPDLAAVARATSLAPGDVQAFFDLFRSTERVVTAFSQGVNQSAQGTDKVNAIINCHLATGRIGRPGMGPLSLTGQPNAMGGREVGGLANMLAAHMGFSAEEIDRVRRFWGAPQMVSQEGLKAVALFEAIREGRIKALWVMGTNPAVSMPRADAVREALGQLDLFVVSEVVRTNDTVASRPHILLPALAWGEKDGTVTNSERRISRQRAFLPPPGDTRPEWWIVSEVAERLGFGHAFRYPSAAAIFREHAALSAFENNGSRDFDIGGLQDLTDAGYDALEPVQWPVRKSDREGQARLFAEGGFFTPDTRARFVAVMPPRLAAAPSAAFPFWLNTGRVRDQWHTMTRTGRSPRLSAHRPVPYVEIHPADAARIGLADRDLARVATPHGSAILEVAVSAGQQLGGLFAPFHWSEATASDGRIGALAQAIVDPVSGQPETKATPATIEPVRFAFGGFLLSRQPVEMPDGWWWARAAVEGGSGTLFACNASLEKVSSFVTALDPAAACAEYADPAQGIQRTSLTRAGRLVAFLAVAPFGTRPLWDAARALFTADELSSGARRSLLAGRAVGDTSGPVVCACFGVGLAAVIAAIQAGHASVEAIGTALRAGTNCGSCVPELRQVLAREAKPQPA